MDMRLRSDAVWFRPMRCRPESLWDCVLKGYPITAIGQSGVPDFGHHSLFEEPQVSLLRNCDGIFFFKPDNEGFHTP